MSPSEPTLLDVEEGSYAFYTWQNIVIACWSTPGTLAGMQRFARVREEVDRRHPEGVSVILLIADRAGLPTAEARATAQELMERYHDKRAALAVVVYGEGFWASAMRAANTGVHAQLQSKIVMQNFSRAEDVAAWLPALHETHTGVRIKSDALLRVLRELSETL